MIDAFVELVLNVLAQYVVAPILWLVGCSLATVAQLAARTLREALRASRWMVGHTFNHGV
jgi:hypothetical protein